MFNCFPRCGALCKCYDIVQSLSSSVLNICLLVSTRCHSLVPFPALHMLFPWPGLCCLLLLTPASALTQEPALCDPQGNSSSLPLFVEKLFFGYTATLIPLCIVWLLSHYSGLVKTVATKAMCPRNLYCLLSGSFMVRFANPLSIILITYTLWFHHQKCFFHSA